MRSWPDPSALSETTAGADTREKDLGPGPAFPAWTLRSRGRCGNGGLHGRLEEGRVRGRRLEDGTAHGHDEKRQRGMMNGRPMGFAVFSGWARVDKRQ